MIISDYRDVEEEEFIKKLDEAIKKEYEEKRMLAIEFAEYCGKTYMKSYNCWIPLYSNQTIKDNWRTTEQLFEQFIKEKYEN